MENTQATQNTESPKFVSSDLLTTEDKTYCDTVFTSYSRHITHVSDLLNTIAIKDKEFQEQQATEEEEQFFSVSKIDKATEALRDTIENLTQSLITKLETYFAKKYCIVFKSLIPDRGTVNLDPLSSYISIVQNITSQVGSELLKAGKEQIKNRFLKSFYRNSLPTLKGNKINIPDFISLDEHFGDRISLYYSHNARLENLVNALNLFLNNSTELPQLITNKFIDWKSSLDLSTPYTVFPDVSFKFYKNQRLDVVFFNPTMALKFWNYYTLEIIEKIITQND